MLIKKDQIPIVIVNVIFLTIFTAVFLSRQNFEFLLYVGVIVFFFVVLLATNRRVNYPTGLLWGLTAWSLLHMSGGGIFIGGSRLYELMLIPLSDSYQILKYDQLVHMVGFGVATGVMYQVIKPVIKPEVTKWTAISIVVVMAGLGVGALNEIVEFLVTVIVPGSGVGGYLNTSLDLVADLIGSVGAMIGIVIFSKQGVK